MKKLAVKRELKPDHRISSDQKRWVVAKSVKGLEFDEEDPQPVDLTDLFDEVLDNRTETLDPGSYDAGAPTDQLSSYVQMVDSHQPQEKPVSVTTIGQSLQAAIVFLAFMVIPVIITMALFGCWFWLNFPVQVELAPYLSCVFIVLAIASLVVLLLTKIRNTGSVKLVRFQEVLAGDGGGGRQQTHVVHFCAVGLLCVFMLFVGFTRIDQRQRLPYDTLATSARYRNFTYNEETHGRFHRQEKMLFYYDRWTVKKQGREVDYSSRWLTLNQEWIPNSEDSPITVVLLRVTENVVGEYLEEETGHHKADAVKIEIRMTLYDTLSGLHLLRTVKGPEPKKRLAPDEMPLSVRDVLRAEIESMPVF